MLGVWYWCTDQTIVRRVLGVRTEADAEFGPIPAGWASLADESVGTILERFAGMPKVKAVRRVLHNEPDDFYMHRADFSRGISHQSVRSSL